MNYGCRYCNAVFTKPSYRQSHEMQIHQGVNYMDGTRFKTELTQRINQKYNIDQKALEIAQRVDDIYAVGGLHVAQRTSRIQLLIIDALENWVRDALMRNNVHEDNFK